MRTRILPLVALVALLSSAPGARGQSPPAQSPPAGGIVEEDLPTEPGQEPPPEAVAEPAEEAPPLEQEARQAYADGNLIQARILYLELADHAASPAESARLRITAAWLSFQLDDRAAASAQLGQALYDVPEAAFSPELYSPEFVALHQDALRDALERRRRSAARKTGLAVDAIRSHDYATARSLLDEAQALAPDDPEIQYDIAFVDLRQGRTDQALTGFERVLALARAPGGAISKDLESRTLNSLALLYYARDDFEAARATLEEALKLDPKDARAWFNLGLARDKLGRRDDAYAALKRARELDRGDVDIARALALAEIDRGRWVDAISLLVQATEARPEDPELQLHLGRAQRGLGNLDGALTSFRAARRLDPGNRLGIAVPAALLAAAALRERGDAAAAAAEAQAALDLDRDEVEAWILLGLARLEQGDPQAALSALEEAERRAPDRADVAHNLGSAKLALRDYDGAEAAFRRALELDPGNAEARTVLAQIEARRAAELAAASGGRRPPELDARVAFADFPQLGIRGLRVETVSVGGAASRAGLRAGDLILAADGQPLSREEDLLRRLAAHPRGVDLDVLRAGARIELKLKAK